MVTFAGPATPTGPAPLSETAGSAIGSVTDTKTVTIT
jgi:hypothetical protein